MAAQGDAGGKAETMREIPVLFNGAMVRDILDGRKTQTRRIVKRQPPGVYSVVKWTQAGDLWYPSPGGSISGLPAERSPLGKPGDRLWARETWMPYDTSTEDDAVWVLYKASNDQRPDGIAPEKFGSGVRRSAPVQVVEWARDAIEMEEVAGGRWRPSIHMPRWAARLFLDVLDVRIERLQDISEEDAWQEGSEAVDGALDEALIARTAKASGYAVDDARATFAALWVSIYGAESWAANPWVWVTTFRKVP